MSCLPDPVEQSSFPSALLGEGHSPKVLQGGDPSHKAILGRPPIPKALGSPAPKALGISSLAFDFEVMVPPSETEEEALMISEFPLGSCLPFLGE